MLKVSRLADYAVVLMACFVEEAAHALYSAHELAALTRLPETTVSKLLKILAKKGLLVSVRGIKGGYKLTKTAAEISIEEIIAAVDGPIAMTECIAEPGECSLEAWCTMRTTWHRINSVVLDALAHTSLADVSQPTVCALTPPSPHREAMH